MIARKSSDLSFLMSQLNYTTVTTSQKTYRYVYYRPLIAVTALSTGTIVNDTE